MTNATEVALATFLSNVHGGEMEDYLSIIDSDYCESHPLEYPFVDDGIGSFARSETVVAELPSYAGALLEDLERVLEAEIKPFKRSWSPEERETRGLSSEQVDKVTHELDALRNTLQTELGNDHEFYLTYAVWETLVLYLFENGLWFDAHQLFSIMGTKMNSPYLSEADHTTIRSKIEFRSEQAKENADGEPSYADMLAPMFPESVVTLVEFYEDLEHLD